MALWSRDQIRFVMRYNFDRGLSLDQCFDEMQTVMKDKTPHCTTIFRWFREFLRGNFDLKDDFRSGRPPEAVTHENIVRAKDMLNENRQIVHRQLEETSDIGAPAVNKILYDHLGVRKVCSLWVPYALTAGQRERRVKWCREMLKRFESGQSRDVLSIVTGDETWLYYYDLPSKSKNKIWIFEDEDTPVQVCKSKSTRKRMTAVFFTSRGLLYRIMLKTQKNYYCVLVCGGVLTSGH